MVVNINLEFKDKQETAYNKIRNFTKIEDINEGTITSKIITAPTQVGKTSSIIELLKETKGYFCTVSCDNKTDQLNQIFIRFKEAKLNVFVLNSCKKRNTNKIIKDLKKGKSVVILLLNNSSQIYKLSCIIKVIKQNISITNYLCIHDEADTVNKVENREENQIVPESHKEWESHFGFTSEIFKHTLRVWVTATCENCSNIANIQGKDIVVLPSPPEYKKVNRHIKWESEDTTLLIYEIERINLNKTGEIILYCYNSLIREQIEKAKLLNKTTDCITVVYNSGSKCVFGYDGYTTFTKNINEVLTDLKEINKAVVIFGNDLMGRGISFTGKGKNSLAATVLFHKDSPSTTAINITQKFGRITGTARPDIVTRSVYCTDKAYNDYQNYLENQKAVYKSLEEYPELNIMDILKIIESKKLNRKVDRASLKKTNKIYKDNSNEVKNKLILPEKQIETIKMKRLIKSWKNTSNETDVAKLFRLMVINKGKLENEKVKELIKNKHNTYYSNLTESEHKANWAYVFTKDSEYHYIKEEAILFYKSLN